MIKILQKLSIEGTYLNLIQDIHDKPTENIILNGSSKIRKKTRVPMPITIIKHSFGNPRHSNQRKRNTRNLDRKRRSKTLFADDMILYIENPKDSTRKSLQLINELSKAPGYKINTEKSLAFLYTSNEKSEKETNEIIPFTMETKRIKYLGINLPERQIIYMLKTLRHWWKKNQRSHKQMERHSMFWDWKNQYC